MKYLKDFMEDDNATLDALAVEMFHLGEGDFKDLMHMLAMRSGLEKLEYLEEISKSTIANYQNLGEWRDEVGEVT